MKTDPFLALLFGLAAALACAHHGVASLGARVYYTNMSLGLAVKKPVWAALNEEDQQQGAQGREAYRLIATCSVLL